MVDVDALWGWIKLLYKTQPIWYRTFVSPLLMWDHDLVVKSIYVCRRFGIEISYTKERVCKPLIMHYIVCKIRFNIYPLKSTHADTNTNLVKAESNPLNYKSDTYNQLVSASMFYWPLYSFERRTLSLYSPRAVFCSSYQ